MQKSRITIVSLIVYDQLFTEIDNLLNLAVEVITQKRVKQKMEINVLENC